MFSTWDLFYLVCFVGIQSDESSDNSVNVLAKISFHFPLVDTDGKEMLKIYLIIKDTMIIR